ncbi:hypothetical protein DPEC_G00096510 [Dallia pectoralis]|uniref:Uncharacterized protein n=1 Tax=Dallia pectoralis TaxID=75939 RepID=A0ACC2GV65_DALPE|nr:hypothetical protein DPEC_G00096510 [Dallia pectoralis]
MDKDGGLNAPGGFSRNPVQNGAAWMCGAESVLCTRALVIGARVHQTQVDKDFSQPNPGNEASTSMGYRRNVDKVETDSVRALYKRSLQLDCSLKELDYCSLKELDCELRRLQLDCSLKELDCELRRLQLDCSLKELDCELRRLLIKLEIRQMEKKTDLAT